MERKIRVHGVRKKEPDIRLLVVALIELARELEAKERAAKEQPAALGEATTP
jgi:hypothetical protein